MRSVSEKGEMYLSFFFFFEKEKKILFRLGVSFEPESNQSTELER